VRVITQGWVRWGIIKGPLARLLKEKATIRIQSSNRHGWASM